MSKHQVMRCRTSNVHFLQLIKHAPYLLPKTAYVQGYQILARSESLVIGHIQSPYGHRLEYKHETKNSFPVKAIFLKIKMYELFTALFVLQYLLADYSITKYKIVLCDVG